MARFAVKTLEFDKVKNMLASKAATFLGKQAIISLQIESEFSKVKRLQEETAEALRILDEGRRFPFGGAFNITADVKRAELGSVLEPEELQHIQTTVQAFASMKDFTAENAETHAQPKSPMPTPMPSHVSAVLAKFGNVNPATPQILQIQPVSKMPSQDALPILTVLPHYNKFATHPQVYVSNV